MKKIAKSIALCALTLSSFITSAQTENSLLWEVSGNGLEKPSYVFGTMHMICKDDYIMTPVIENTLKNVEVYYAEINFGDPNTTAVMQKEMIAKVPLSKRLTTDKYNELKKLLKETVEINIDQFENLSDAAIVSTVTVKSFPCTDFKMYEMEFLQSALKYQKKVGGLETIEQQMEIMSKSLTIDAVIEMLREFKEKGLESNRKMVDLYKEQQINPLHDLLRESSYMTSDVYNEILTVRNHNWMEQMPELMRNHSVFFAVGAAHLGGDQGILRLLTEHGYTLKPINIL